MTSHSLKAANLLMSDVFETVSLRFSIKMKNKKWQTEPFFYPLGFLRGHKAVSTYYCSWCDKNQSITACITDQSFWPINQWHPRTIQLRVPVNWTSDILFINHGYLEFTAHFVHFGQLSFTRICSNRSVVHSSPPPSPRHNCSTSGKDDYPCNIGSWLEI